MKPYVVRKMMLVIATFACLLGGTWLFYTTAPHAEGAKATKPKAQPMVLVYDTTKSAGTTITLPILGRAGERLGKANVTASNDTFTLSSHGLKNGQEIWLSGTSDINTTKPYRVMNAKKNTFSLIEMSTGEKGTGFNPGEKVNTDADATVGVHKTILPDVTIQWGDGKTSRVTASGLATHTYAKKGKYTVMLTGRLPQLGWGIVNDFLCNGYNSPKGFPGIEKLVEVLTFGALDTHSLSGAFAGAVSLTAVPEALPATVTDISFMFNGAKTFNDNIAQWNTANVTNMSAMFCGATAFNQPLGQWNVAKVTNMSSMFDDAETFNQPLEKWNVSQVTNMKAMFSGAVAFNQPLEKWNVSQVTNMSWMFSLTGAFNQPLAQWNVSKVSDMSFMFIFSRAFNQPLEKWNVSPIKVEPKGFSTDATNWKKAKPQWGTCP